MPSYFLRLFLNSSAPTRHSLTIVFFDCIELMLMQRIEENGKVEVTMGMMRTASCEGLVEVNGYPIY